MNLGTGTIAGQLHDFTMIMGIARQYDKEVSRIGSHVKKLILAPYSSSGKASK
jgi:hypothetical protein